MLLVLHILQLWQCKQIFNNFLVFKILILNSSDVCSIPDGDSVLLTGGVCFYHWEDCPCTSDWSIPGCRREASSKVHRYTQEQGWMEDLPDMTVGRYGHGCAAFTMNQEQVRDQKNLQFLFNYISDLPRCWRMWTVAVGFRWI